jgi:macrolide transport system ATP-binding/permease protein
MTLDDVSFGISKGEMLAILGPSGSGKSTLLNVLGCMLAPPQGTVFLEGVDIGRLSNDELARLRSERFGFVFQQFHLIPRMTVLDNIMLPIECSPMAINTQETRDRGLLLAKRLGLDHLLRKFPNQLSGGQQQRVAICRALVMQPEILIADEPTGNLDSQTGEEILRILGELNAEGTTVIIVTHDAKVADRCSRRLEVDDGRVAATASPAHNTTDKIQESGGPGSQSRARLRRLGFFRLSLLKNLWRNWLRSLLTMSGVAIGIASVLAMVTLGRYTENSILKTYEALGVNKVSFSGQPNWQMKATDNVRTTFSEFTDHDLNVVSKIFPELARLSPVMLLWNAKTFYGGREVEETRILGVNEHYIPITNGSLAAGGPVLQRHVALRSSVCVVGFDVAESLFRRIAPVGQTLFLGIGQSVFPCHVIGVLERRSAPDQGPDLNKLVLVPYTFAKVIADNPWNRRVVNVIGQARSGTDVADLAKGVKAFFQNKYGKSIFFNVSQNDVVVSQMKRFLSVFSLLLGSIASVALIIGGIGLANMMLVSVAERYREIGVRKAVGATDRWIRSLFLGESLLLCTISGFFGIALGFGVYQSLIWAAAEFSDRIEFAWVIDLQAIILSFTGIVAVGIISGLVPALKAQKLQIVEALRSE